MQRRVSWVTVVKEGTVSIPEVNLNTSTIQYSKLPENTDAQTHDVVYNSGEGSGPLMSTERFSPHSKF